LQVERAGYEIELRRVAKENAGRTIKVKQAQLDAVENELERRKVIAPLHGVVVKRTKYVGEWVQPGETILEIVRLDRLRVEGFVPASQYSRLEVAGAPVTVSVRVPTVDGDPKKITAKGVIEYVSPIVEASGGYRVWTEIDNRKERGRDGKEHWMFNPGAIATMEISLESRAATRPVSTVRGER
jgi:macrolide-specific efflux system membrane fusion protein